MQPNERKTRPPRPPDPPPAPARGPARFWLALAIIITVAGGLRFALLAEYLHKNPLATRPLIDAETYWQWGGRIAAGQWSQSEPFFSAPLYPYLVGLWRVCGAGLPGVYSIQIVLDLLTIVLLAGIGRKRFGPAEGLVAAALFALLLEPASFAIRILGSTVQLPIVCLAWLALLSVESRPNSWWRAALAGGALGLFALSFPPALLLVPLVALWLWWRAGHRFNALRPAAVLALGSAVVISPATIYNYRICGELIPISAQAGVTFAHGNGPTADGTYTAIPGISPNQAAQNHDAMRRYQEATGAPTSWNDMSRHYLRMGLSNWSADPARTVRLLAAKLWYFLTGRNYGDIYTPVAERRAGLAWGLWTMPIQTAWLIPPALVALVIWWWRRQGLIETLLLALPLLVVVLFFYSPRYRLPAVPVLVIASAWALVQLSPRHWKPAVSVPIVLALAAAVAAGLLNRAVGFDPLPPRQAHLYAHLGWAEAKNGRAEAAIAWFQKALHEMPADSFAQQQMGRTLLTLNRHPEALQYLRRAAQLQPDNAEIRNDLANGLLQSGDRAGAQAEYEAALRLEPNHAPTHLNLALLLRQSGNLDAALAHLQTAVANDPTLPLAQVQLGSLLLDRGDGRGLDALRQALTLAPSDPGIVGTVAWYLATVPGLPADDRTTALQLAQQLNTATGGRSPQLLNTLAAALAATGRYDEAVATIEQAIAAAERMGAASLAEKLRARRDLYRAGQPSVTPLGPPQP